jgi:outer membrane protein assembly factor BamB
MPISYRIATALLVTLWTTVAAAQDWPQWGGPGRDFEVADPGLATSWPEAGLEPLWSRPLGEGYSGIAVVGDRLFTLYGEGDEEVVVALATATGEEIWSHRYEAPRPDGMRLNYGPGPHATPLAAAGRVFTVGTTGQLLALDAATGKQLWRQDLWREHGGFRLRRGYGASPIAWGDTVIVPVGGEAPGAIAFAAADGAVVWQSERFDSAQSSPIVMQVGGQSQMVLFIQDEVVGLDPDDGMLLWRHPHKVLGPYNISTPVTGADGTVFVSSSYNGGSRLLRLSRDETATRVEELWHSKRMGIHFTNALRIGDRFFASTGRSGVVAAALDAGTGELVWRSRAIGRASYLRVGDRLLALEAEGRLLLFELGPDGPLVLAETQLMEAQSWTVPALAGNRLYARDRERILVVELPLAAGGSP